MIVFLIFAWVSIWRCWRNTQTPLWGYVARLFVVMYALLVFAMALQLISEVLEQRRMS